MKNTTIIGAGLVAVAALGFGSLAFAACSTAAVDSEPWPARGVVETPVASTVGPVRTSTPAAPTRGTPAPSGVTNRSEPVFVADTSDIEFWSGFGMPGAIEWERYSSLAQMTNTANVVVLGRAIGTGPSWKAAGDPDQPNDVQGLTTVRVEILEVLAGELDPESGVGEIMVTGMNVPDGSAVAKAPAILFLRHHMDRSLLPPAPVIEDPRDRAAYEEQLASYLDFAQDKYRLVSSQGIFVETSRGTVNPAIDWIDPVSKEVQDRAITDVMGEIRSVAGHPELAATLEDFYCCDPPD